MFGIRTIFAAALVAALIIAPKGSLGEQATTTPPAQPNYRGAFSTEVLAGGTVNELKLPFPASRLPDLSTIKLQVTSWDKPSFRWLPWNSLRQRLCGSEHPPLPTPAVSHREPDPAKGEHFIGIHIPEAPCWLPMSQSAQIKILGTIVEANNVQKQNETLYDGRSYVTVFWLPLALTLLAVGLIYPGCALVYWYMRKQKYKRERGPEKPPGFLKSLDPVQITANPWGRGSLSKLQIFLFTMIVFALLLFFQLRSGVLADMSSDVMWLLGISAIGAVGGKIVLTNNRRLSFENWAWLIRYRWLPKTGTRDLAPRAKWSELFLDSDSNEFDPYSFQMAVFSLVVAVALARTSVSGLGTFKIPEQLLYLLGLSQALFVGGKALGGSGYKELGDKLDEVRRHKQTVVVLKNKPDAKPEEKPAAENALKESMAQAAQIFAELYRDQLPDGIPKEVNDAINKMGVIDNPPVAAPLQP